MIGEHANSGTLLILNACLWTESTLFANRAINYYNEPFGFVLFATDHFLTIAALKLTFLSLLYA